MSAEAARKPRAATAAAASAGAGHGPLAAIGEEAVASGVAGLKATLQSEVLQQEAEAEKADRAAAASKKRRPGRPSRKDRTAAEVAAAALATSRHAWFSEPAIPQKAYDGGEGVDGAFEPLAISSAVGEGNWSAAGDNGERPCFSAVCSAFCSALRGCHVNSLSAAQLAQTYSPRRLYHAPAP